MLSRSQFATALAGRLTREHETLAAQFRAGAPCRHFVVDDVLPGDDLEALARAFPPADQLLLKRSLREQKRVGVAVERYDARIGDLLFAFQAPEVVESIARITGIEGLEPDPSLYASGISVMTRGDFLDPHLDNSHDGDQRRYRALNLLFYVSPGWQITDGGALELWDVRGRTPLTLPARFGRLVVMETGRTSWHSVSRVTGERPRYCVSNYYFTAAAPGGVDYRHVTTFRGRPEQPWKRVALGVDGLCRNAIGRLFPAVLRRSAHRREAAD